jgi:hypothetical protein
MEELLTNAERRRNHAEERKEMALKYAQDKSNSKKFETQV